MIEPEADKDPVPTLPHFIVVSRMGHLAFVAHEGDDKAAALAAYWELTKGGRYARLYEVRPVVII